MLNEIPLELLVAEQAIVKDISIYIYTHIYDISIVRLYNVVIELCSMKRISSPYLISAFYAWYIHLVTDGFHTWKPGNPTPDVIWPWPNFQ